MKYNKKFTAIQIKTKNVNDSIIVELKYGDVNGPYYSKEYPNEIFDTEEEAIEFAHSESKYSNWLILPIISFNIYED